MCYFRKRETALERFYFLFSFALLLCRTVAVCLFAAKINEEGLKSLHYIPVIRSDIYSTEVSKKKMMSSCGFDPRSLVWQARMQTIWLQFLAEWLSCLSAKQKV